MAHVHASPPECGHVAQLRGESPQVVVGEVEETELEVAQTEAELLEAIVPEGGAGDVQRRGALGVKRLRVDVNDQE